MGVPYDDDLGYDSGSAYVFERAGGVWTRVAKLTASDGAPGDSFGWSVAIDDDTLIIGAHYDDDLGWNAGSAYVFERVGGVWTQVAKLIASDGAAFDDFGSSVSTHGDTAIVGAADDDDLGEDSGSVYIFEKVNNVWTQVAKLTSPDGAPSDYLGRAVSINDDKVIAGAIGDDDLGSSSGSAYVFDLVCTCLTDFNRDLLLDTRDLLAFLNAWASGDSTADYNGDGTVDTQDFTDFLNDWVAGC